MIESEYEIGDPVVYGEKKYFITGVKLKIGYDLILYEYWITKATYGDHPFNAFGGRCDFDTVGPLRSEQLFDPKEWASKQLETKKAEIERLEKELFDLKEELT